MRARRVALLRWIESSRLVDIETAALSAQIEDTQSAIAMELAGWHELMSLLEDFERRLAAVKGAAVDP